MNTFTESGLQFEFAAPWQIFKFDQHRFYQYLSGHGLKGVDFIGLHQETGQLLLLEVKNFAPLAWGGRSPTEESVLDDPEAYAQQMIPKFEDSIRLLKIIHGFYQKKWGYRWIFDLVQEKKWLSFLPHFEGFFWLKAFQITQKQAQQVRLILWMEWEADIETARLHHFQKILSQNLTSYFEQKGYSFTLRSIRNSEPGIQAHKIK